jgi:hypothetical protein
MDIATIDDYLEPTILDHIVVNVLNVLGVLNLSVLFFLLIISGLCTYKHLTQESRKPLILENFEPSQAEKLATELRQIEGITVIIK